MSKVDPVEMRKLVELAEEHKKRMPAKESSSADEIVEGFVERMLAAIPDTDKLSEPECAAVKEPRDRARPNTILVSNGWPERYAESLSEPVGEDWHAGLMRLRPVTESGGIALLHGKRGTGKTRMAVEAARRSWFPPDRRRGKMIAGNAEQRYTGVYCTAMRFFLRIQETYKEHIKGTALSVIDALTDPGLLVLDELQERSESPWENRLLVHLIDARYNAKLPTILISNQTKSELEVSLGPSITDRIAENGVRVEFTWGSFRRARR